MNENYDIFSSKVSKLKWQVLRKGQNLLTIFCTFDSEQNLPPQLEKDSFITICQTNSGGCKQLYCLVKKGNPINTIKLSSFFLTTISVPLDLVVESKIY